MIAQQRPPRFAVRHPRVVGGTIIAQQLPPSFPTRPLSSIVFPLPPSVLSGIPCLGLPQAAGCGAGRPPSLHGMPVRLPRTGAVGCASPDWAPLPTLNFTSVSHPIHTRPPPPTHSPRAARPCRPQYGGTGIHTCGGCRPCGAGGAGGARPGGGSIGDNCGQPCGGGCAHPWAAHQREGGRHSSGGASLPQHSSSHPPLVLPPENPRLRPPHPLRHPSCPAYSSLRAPSLPSRSPLFFPHPQLRPIFSFPPLDDVRALGKTMAPLSVTYIAKNCCYIVIQVRSVMCDPGRQALSLPPPLLWHPSGISPIWVCIRVSMIRRLLGPWLHSCQLSLAPVPSPICRRRRPLSSM